MEGGWTNQWMKGWMIERMDGVSKNIKIGDYILYAKNIYEGERRKIYPRKR
jgi:hypothetical protein